MGTHIRWLFGRLVRYAVPFVAGLLFTGASAEDFGELEGSEHSPTFTAAERKLFVDAVSRFRTHQIPVRYFNGSAHWLDDEHLVFSSREYPGWKAQPDEPPRIVVYNVASGEIRDSGYRGRLDCLNHLGDLMLMLPIRREDLGFSPNNYRWFIGRWGQPLKEIEHEPRSFVPTYLCRYVPHAQPILRYSPDVKKGDGGKVIPLLPCHGELYESVIKQENNLVNYLHLVKEDGTTVFIRNSKVRIYRLVFHRWSNEYFESGSTAVPPTTLKLTGEHKVHPLPHLISYWDKSNVGAGAGYASREGLLWAIRTARGLWRKQGVYLDTGKELIRVEEGAIAGPIQVSPDGCKAFWESLRGDPFELNKKYLTYVADICEGLRK